MASLKIVTFNIRTLYSNPIDGVNSFIHRAGLILETLRQKNPHVVCFQEVSPQIREFLDRYLTDYHLVGHGRLADYSGEGLAIAYRKDTMNLLGLENFWLSPTPNVPGSRYEIQSEYPRLCTCALLKHRDIPQPVKFYNVHLDHESDQARILGIRQILEKVDRDHSPFPTFIMGDFNARADSETITYCKEYKSYPIVDLTADSGITFHAFGQKTEYIKIDYIFADAETAKRSHTAEKWEDCLHGIYLSDHYPLCCQIEMGE